MTVRRANGRRAQTSSLAVVPAASVRAGDAASPVQLPDAATAVVEPGGEALASGRPQRAVASLAPRPHGANRGRGRPRRTTFTSRPGRRVAVGLRGRSLAQIRSSGSRRTCSSSSDRARSSAAVAGRDLLVGIEVEPALPALSFGACPRRAERLPAAARERDQVLLQRIDAERVVDRDICGVPSGPSVRTKKRSPSRKNVVVTPSA